MLRLHYRISEKEYLATYAAKKFFGNCQRRIENSKVAISNILKCVIFLALVSVAILPLLGMAFLVNEDNSTDSRV